MTDASRKHTLHPALTDANRERQNGKGSVLYFVHSWRKFWAWLARCALNMKGRQFVVANSGAMAVV